MQRNLAAFTLVEILVVILVTSILAAIIVPVLAASRERGKMSACASNLHQIGLAIAAYEQDNDQQRPTGFQSLSDSGLVTDKHIFLCPDDPTGNWGGLIYEQARQGMYPGTPPETVKHSYIYAFTEESHPDITWKELTSIDGDPGIVACQLHGTATGFNYPGAIPSESLHTGKTLRLRIDGSVVARNVDWATTTDKDGNQSMSTDEFRLFTDAPSPNGLP